MTDLGQAWIAAIRAGLFEEAWTLTERDLRLRDRASRDDPNLPYHLRWVWDGRPFGERRVLIRCYHGLGDTIQFARYLPAMVSRASSVTVEVQPPLLPLLSQIPGITLVPFDPAHPLKPADCDIEIMELAFALRMRPDEVQPPYLRAPILQVAEGAIGLCHLASDWDAERCIPPELFTAICRDHDCFSLVPGDCSLPVRNREGCSLEIMETASLVASTELVITVDTMIAHLAGALGRPTWLLLKADPDWRWSLGSASHWYPSMRLYRQRHAGDWTSVIAEVRQDLAAQAR
jgi:hypothetical protein